MDAMKICQKKKNLIKNLFNFKMSPIFPENSRLSPNFFLTLSYMKGKTCKTDVSKSVKKVQARKQSLTVNINSFCNQKCQINKFVRHGYTMYFDILNILWVR